MTESYTSAISAAYEDIIQKIYTVNLHEVGETWKAYEHDADIRESEGRTRMFALEFGSAPMPITIGTTDEDNRTIINIVIGYDTGPESYRAAMADFGAIRYKLNNPSSIPDGVAFYLVTEPPTFETTDTFRWMTIPVIIETSTTME